MHAYIGLPRLCTTGKEVIEMMRCSECGMEISTNEMIAFGKTLICGKCKPFYLQRLREGVAVAGEMVYAGFWIRFGAKFIDGIIMWVLGLAISFAAGHGGMKTYVFSTIVSWVFCIAYVVYFLGKFGATPGKMACGLKVVRSDGEKITYARAFGRFFAEFVSSIILCIGYIMAGFDGEKRALHDRICDTRVIQPRLSTAGSKEVVSKQSRRSQVMEA